VLSGGLREKRLKKTLVLNTPLISIVSVVHNARGVLEKTIISIIGQTYKNIEYIIIDAKSTDGTLDIIKKYEDKIDYWVSDSDHGIYDAMNKGIYLANGKWINFMNAGDYFYSSDVIRKFIDINPVLLNNYYGDNIYFNDNISYTFIANLNSKIKFLRHNAFSHQAVFYSVELIKKINGYDTQLKISSDFDLTFRLFLISRFIKINRIIAVCNARGFSTTNTLLSYFNRIQSFKKNKVYLFMWLLIINFPFFFVKHKIILISRNMKIYNLYRRIKYKTIKDV
jgi:glycosyltransferase involved in cell wall biosynthesis